MRTMTSTTTRATVLADLLPAVRIRDTALVIAGTALLVVAGQLAVPLWFTPVPLSLATFAVLLDGAALGPVRAAASTLLYLALGVAGAPIFASHASGWSFASFGYIVGYVPAAIVVGALARRGAGRSLLATAAAAGAGTLIIYAIGLPWLIIHLGTDVATGLELGVVPFLLGDAVKALLAALLLPATWRLLGQRGTEPPFPSGSRADSVE